MTDQQAKWFRDMIEFIAFMRDEHQWRYDWVIAGTMVTCVGTHASVPHFVNDNGPKR